MMHAYKNITELRGYPSTWAAEPPNTCARCSSFGLTVGLLNWNLLAARESACYQTSLGCHQAGLPRDSFTLLCSQGGGLYRLYSCADYFYGLLPSDCWLGSGVAGYQQGIKWRRAFVQVALTTAASPPGGHSSPGTRSWLSPTLTPLAFLVFCCY